MAGAEKLRDKILQDARREADANLAQARHEAEEIVLKAREEARALQASLAAKAEREAAEREKRLVSIAELEGRKERLAVKQRLIDELFGSAVKTLCEKPDKEYEALLADMISSAALGGEEVVLSEKDKSRMSDRFLESVNSAMAEKGKTGRVAVSPESGHIDGGFILRMGRTEINNSFGAVVRANKDSLEALAVKMLFG